MIKKADIILIICLIVFAISFLFIFNLSGNEKGGQIVISVDGKPYETMDIYEHENETFLIQTQQGTNTILISDGKIKMTDATCPDKICVHQGHISGNNESIVCLPNKVVVEIKSGSSSDVDTILR